MFPSISCCGWPGRTCAIQERRQMLSSGSLWAATLEPRYRACGHVRMTVNATRNADAPSRGCRVTRDAGSVSEKRAPSWNAKAAKFAKKDIFVCGLRGLRVLSWTVIADTRLARII